MRIFTSGRIPCQTEHPSPRWVQPVSLPSAEAVSSHVPFCMHIKLSLPSYHHTSLLSVFLVNFRTHRGRSKSHPCSNSLGSDRDPEWIFFIVLGDHLSCSWAVDLPCCVEVWTCLPSPAVGLTENQVFKATSLWAALFCSFKLSQTPTSKLSRNERS